MKRLGKSTPRLLALLVAVSLLPLLIMACNDKKKPKPTPESLLPLISGKSGATPSADVLQQLQQQVSSGRLEQPVYDAIRDKGAADAIITLNEEVVNQRLKQAAAALGLTLNDQQAVDLRVKVYEELKQQLTVLGPGAATVLEDFKNFGSIQVRFASGAILLAVLQRPEVASVTANEQFKKQEADQASNPRPPLSVSLSLINQPQAVSAGFTGAGISVAILDSGGDYKRDAFGPCTAPGQPADKCRVIVHQHIAPDDGLLDSDKESMHGTNVSGIIAGVAPGARIITLDIFDGDHTSSTLELSALDWVMSHRQQYNIVATNMSVGASKTYYTSPCTESPLGSAFEQLRRAGIVPVLSAGNDAMATGRVFTNGIGRPACATGAVSVGAVYVADVGRTDFGDCGDNTTKADLITCFSQSGPNLTILAPGSRITAAGVTESGTSQASPHVTAAAAMLAAKCPSATVDQIVAALTNSGPVLTDPRNGEKKHRLDVAAAGQTLMNDGGCRNAPRTATATATATATSSARPATVAPTTPPTTPPTAPPALPTLAPTTPPPTQSPPAGSGGATQQLNSALLNMPYEISELPLGFTAAHPGTDSLTDTARKFNAAFAVNVDLLGPDDVDLLIYNIFPRDADAKAYFNDQGASPDFKPSGFSSSVACSTGAIATDSGDKYGVTRCVVLQGNVVLRTATAIKGNGKKGNNSAAAALAKSALSHLQKVQKGQKTR